MLYRASWKVPYFRDQSKKVNYGAADNFQESVDSFLPPSVGKAHMIATWW